MAKKKIENNNEATKSIAFETLNNKQLAEAFETDLEKGLTSEQAKKRLEKNGENKLAEKKKKSVIRMFFEQMKDPMIYVLFAAIALTIGVSIYETLTADPALVSNWFLDVGDWPDVIIIMAVIIINSIIGTVQEVKAQTSLEALKKLSSPESTVIRDGKHVRVKASELVVGDIVVLEEGDTVGADIRLIESSNLKAAPTIRDFFKIFLTGSRSIAGTQIPISILLAFANLPSSLACKANSFASVTVLFIFQLPNNNFLLIINQLHQFLEDVHQVQSFQERLRHQLKHVRTYQHIQIL